MIEREKLVCHYLTLGFHFHDHQCCGHQCLNGEVVEAIQTSVEYDYISLT